MPDLSNIEIGDTIEWTSKGEVYEKLTRDDGVGLIMVKVHTSKLRTPTRRCIIDTELNTKVKIIKRATPAEPVVNTVIKFMADPEFPIVAIRRTIGYWQVAGLTNRYTWAELLQTFSPDGKSFEVVHHA